MKFNIALLACTATAACHVKNPAGELLFADEERTLPVRIHLHGPGSKAYGVVESRQSARALKRMQDNDGKITAATPEERIAETAEDLAAITSHFENFEYQPAGAAEPIEGEDLFRTVYANQGLGFITRQVTKFVGDWGNFSAVSKAA
ncbi:hypothetical protein C8J25_108163 [Sphingomonas faeni]|uniref:Uncharacterized protein n=1 Tax=Sphingomonas faeni TaxID=185950 RepID=A0A2T5U0P0_9SPHN|nr:hypothetical protein [Sphingomonas faeni]PTW45071.1 hypothetical protein C8J25_108163 [Sphingomonas faeni]